MFFAVYCVKLKYNFRCIFEEVVSINSMIYFCQDLTQNFTFKGQAVFKLWPLKRNFLVFFCVKLKLNFPSISDGIDG
jgi:hypothetical protein